MSGRISSYQVEAWLAQFQRVWCALHYDDPEIAGAYASEVFGGGYARTQVTFSQPNARATWNINVVAFTGLPSVTITHVALWDAEANGNYLASISLDTPIRVIGGRQISFAARALAISLD